MTPTDPFRADAAQHRYDVFVSYSRYQREWVRAFVALLRAAGLTVFLDDDLPPGVNVVEAIGRAADESRNLVLVLSRAALRSDWVGLESAIAVARDPDADEGRLVPVLLEALESKEILPALRIRNYLDLSSAEERDANLLRLLRHLGAAPADGRAPALPWPVSSLRAVGMDEVRDWGWSGEDLLRVLVDLDGELYGGLSAPAEELVAKWTPMFVDHPATWRVLTDAPGSVVGYWHVVALFDEDFAAARRGELSYRALTPDRLRLLELPGWYDLYVSGMGIQARHRKPPAFIRLFDSLLEVAEELARNDVFISQVCANGYTDHGVSLCRSLELERTAAHRERGQVFSAPFAALLGRPVFGRRPGLRALYAGRAPGSA
ncbi:MAG TPA: toll/interleukin-1 receptor domain-containing protein [Longimicrobiaceae bacterium]|nr:toll/interleukin-1 receptor domain-containing protein [Longimicrobiaceae bacterium]